MPGTFEHQLGTVRYQQAKYKEARTLLEKAFIERTLKLGSKNPKTVESMLQLAETLNALNELNEAEHLYKSALTRRKEILGETHTDTVNVQERLAAFYEKIDRLDLAEAFLTRALQVRKKSSVDNLDTAIVMANLGNIKAKRKDYGEAERLQNEALRIVVKICGEKHFLTAKLMHNLAVCHQDQKNFAKARELLLRSIAIEENLRVASEEIQISRQRLAALES